MAEIMFYARPVALNRDRHLKLKLAVAPNHFAFAAKTNAVPIASNELIEAARDYPIVFVGEEGGPFNVAALVGLRNNENLMVDTEGRWAPGTYIPAFARRYPFVLARTPESEQQLTVCVDEVYPGLSEETGEALFEADGTESAYLKRLLEFLQLFHQEAERTAAFANRLRDLGLLVPKVINVERKGERQVLQGLWIVDGAKLAGIDDARVVELFRLGYLHWIQAHLISLGSLSRLTALLDEHSALVEETAPAGEAAVVPEAPAKGKKK